MCGLCEPLGARAVVDPDPEAITRRRRDLNAQLGLDLQPTPYERDAYTRDRHTPPID